MVVERVEHDRDRVVAAHVAVALHRVDGDERRIGIGARDPEVEVPAVDEDADLGAEGRRLAGLRRLLDEVRDDAGLGPGGLVEHAVEADLPQGVPGGDEVRRRLGRLRTGPAGEDREDRHGREPAAPGARDAAGISITCSVLPA